MSPRSSEGPWVEVVGVVKDIPVRMSAARPFVYVSHPQALALGAGGTGMIVMLKTEVSPESVAGDFREASRSVDPTVSASRMMPLEDFLDDLLVGDRLSVIVMAVSSVLALMLVAVGVYGLLSYLVANRTREFGIRLALGAAAQNLKSIVLREAITLALAGVSLGLAGAFVVARLSRGLLVGVAATDPLSMAAGVSMVVLVTLVAAYVPARRAMEADPVIALRAE